MALLALKVTTAVTPAGGSVAATTSVKSAAVTVAAPITLGIQQNFVLGPPGVGPQWKGLYSSGTTYAQGDGVTGSNGHNYISLVSSNLNHDPTTDAGVHWADTLPPSVPTISPFGGAIASTPTVWLDSYYDSTAYANKTAAIQAAYAAAVAGRAVLECRASRVYSLDTGPLLLNPSTPITILGNGATFQANWGKPRVLGFNRTADYQTWNDIDIRDLTFDGNNLTSVSNVVLTGELGGNASLRVNFARVYFRRCHWINVPRGINYVCCSIISTHAGPGETTTTITDVRLERAYMRGGNYGATIQGTSQTAPPNSTVEVFLDNIYVDLDHDTGAVPSASAAGANLQIGSLGYGGYCEVHLVGANSTDVGIEVDGFQKADIWGTITDSINVEWFTCNFHAPPHQASQQVIFHSCQARVINLNPDAATFASTGFAVGHVNAPIVAFGHVIYENCSYYCAASNLTVRGSALSLLGDGALVDRITIVGTFEAVYESINSLPGSGQTPRPIYIFTGSNPTRFSVKGKIRISFAGTVNTNVTPSFITFLGNGAGTSVVFDIDEAEFASSLAGIAVGGTRGLQLGLGGAGAGCVVRGTVRKLGWGSFSGADTAPQLLSTTNSTQVTITPSVDVMEVDRVLDPVAAPVLVTNADTTNKAKIALHRVRQQTFPLPSVAMGSTNFASATFTTATGNQYIGNLPAEIHFATGTGAGITAIDVSKDGTTYENAYTQASGAMAQSVLVPVENGDFIKVTFATTQPTTRVRFRRAQ